jgi:hypothetical protein
MTVPLITIDAFNDVELAAKAIEEGCTVKSEAVEPIVLEVEHFTGVVENPNLTNPVGCESSWKTKGLSVRPLLDE